MLSFKKSVNKIRDRIFNQVHKNNLIYNTCWEDPRCDRAMLNFDENSKVVMITSAGCNALDYLLDKPSAIHCIDLNPRQNALLELKKSMFLHATFLELWMLFGEGKYDRAMALYAEKLRENLPEYAHKFWDRNMIQFTKRSFYFLGTSGTFAWIFYQYFKTRPKLRKLTDQLLEAETLADQAKFYNQIEPKIITQVLKWFINRHLTLTLLGVPRAQRKLIVDEYPGKVAGFVADCLRHVFTELPIQDNYFWRVYMKGNYTKNCSPNYLKEEHFDTLKNRVQNIHLHTRSMADFLRAHPDKYSHFILLDHQDWLAAHDKEELNEEWNLILKNSRKGTKILLRSAAQKVDFFPDFVKEAVKFDFDTTNAQHRLDRVGTYGSVYLGIVQ